MARTASEVTGQLSAGATDLPGRWTSPVEQEPAPAGSMAGMEPPSDAPGWLRAVTAAERPDLWELVTSRHLFDDVWPEYNHHGNHTGRYFGALVPAHAHLQVLFIDERRDRVVARARTIPFRWEGTLADLPAGIDAAGIRAVTEAAPPSALSALAAEVDPGYQGSGLSALLIEAMRSVTRRHGLAPLLAPVRPNWKDRYPLAPIERYAQWRRHDGLPSTPGCEPTNDWAGGFCVANPDRWRSAHRWPIGNAGPACGSRKPAGTSLPTDWPRWRSPTDRAPTSSPMSGSSTRYDYRHRKLDFRRHRSGSENLLLRVVK